MGDGRDLRTRLASEPKNKITRDRCGGAGWYYTVRTVIMHDSLDDLSNELVSTLLLKVHVPHDNPAIISIFFAVLQ
jgi:hypothetical protein